MATVFLVLGFVIGLLIFAFGRGFRVRHTSSYIGGEKLSAENAHYSGTSFYSTIRSLPLIRNVFKDAERESFDIYHIGGRWGNPLVQVLRRCQTGVLPLYVSWVVLGLVLVIVYLIGGAGGQP